MPALPTDLQTAASADVNAPAVFVYLDVVDDPLLAWTGRGNIQITGSGDPLLALDPTFFGLGVIGGVSDVVHGSGGALSEATFLLNYADFDDDATQSFINDATKWSRRAAVVWTGFINMDTGALIAPPVRIATMRMLSVQSVDGDQPRISVKSAAKSAVDGQRANGWKLADAHQQAFWPGDRALAFMPYLVGRELRFGTANSSYQGPILPQPAPAFTYPDFYNFGRFF